MKKQTAKKRTSTRTKNVKINTKSTRRNFKGWRIIGEWAVAIPLAVLIVLAAGYLTRGWIRFHAEPALASWSADNTQKILDTQMHDLNNPLVRLGISQKNTTKSCVTVYANNFSTQIICSTAYQGYLPDARGLNPSLAVRAADLQSSLKTQGWDGANTTLSELGSNISKGIDYTPDATYQKQVGEYNCMVSFTTAFSHPRPPAINGVVSCVRYYGIFGGQPTNG